MSAANLAQQTREQAEAQRVERERRIREGAWAIERAFAPMLGLDASLNPGMQITPEVVHIAPQPEATAPRPRAPQYGAMSEERADQRRREYEMEMAAWKASRRQQPQPTTATRFRVGDQLFDTEDAAQAFIASQPKPAPVESSFFRDFEQSIIDTQKPQLQRQFDTGFGQMAAELARRGMLESTFGANRVADMNATFAGESANIVNRAKDQSQNLRGQIEAQKNDLFDLNSSAADPTLLGARARASATSIAVPSASTPIGDVFTGALGPLTAFQSARMNSPGQADRPRPAPVATGAGSSRIVGGR